MKGLFLSIPVALIAIFMAGCSTTSMLSASNNGATVDVKTNQTASIPRTETFKATSFGNYEFRARAPGQEPFFGILPLKFNGGHLAVDILLFAPAAFFNLREPFPFYDFDIEKKIVKYRLKENEEWRSYTPLEAEALRAKEFFKDK